MTYLSSWVHSKPGIIFYGRARGDPLKTPTKSVVHLQPELANKRHITHSYIDSTPRFECGKERDGRIQVRDSGSY